jgi:hypothetical protein
VDSFIRCKICEICGIELESHKYYAHISKEHGVKNIYTDIRLNTYNKYPAKHDSVQTKTKSNKKELSAKEKKPNKFSIEYKPTFYPDKRTNSKEPDGSKEWHNIRDHGQFGSFPSFEPMDEE